MNELSFEISEEQEIILQKMMNTAVSEGVRSAFRQIENENKLKTDKRLNNTHLLLKNYNLFKAHIDDITYKNTSYTTKELEKVADYVLDDKESDFIQAILKTKQRTKIMLQHIDNCLNMYKLKCVTSNKEDVQRRYKVLELLYLKLNDDGENYTTEDVSKTMYISTGSVSSTKKIAINELSILLFRYRCIEI